MAGYNHSGHRQRLKKRFLKENSFDNFEPHVILEMLLFYTVPRKDTNELAHRIIDYFSSLSAVFDAPYEALLEFDGITENTACLIKSVVPLSRAYYNDKYNCPMVLNDTSDTADYLLNRYLGYKEEVFGVISLDNKNSVLSFDIVAKGGHGAVVAEARSVVEIIIKTGASAVILAHNHPGGLAIPSGGDISQTRLIISACRSVGVRVCDHIIIAGNDCVSMRSTKAYTPMFD